MARTATKLKKATRRKITKPHKAKRSKKEQGKKSIGVKPSKVFVYALAMAALGGGGYLIYDRMKKRKMEQQNQIPSEATDIVINNGLPTARQGLPASFSSFASKVLTSATDNFPLKRGSRGARVTALQQALVKTTPSILVDGQFGPQTAGALKTAGYPATIDEALFNKITGASKDTVQVVFNPATLATSLYTAAQAKNLDQVQRVLKEIKSVSDYISVNDYYKKQSFISKTIVTDLLEYAFKTNEAAKELLRKEFLRIGLKVSSSGSWSLQGIRLYRDLITIRDTVVVDAQNNRIPVRRNTILGDELEVANGITWFQSIDHNLLNVPTQDVKYT